jgi:tripartite-type tricarboxylate transporter receptor subunit TctC
MKLPRRNFLHLGRGRRRAPGRVAIGESASLSTRPVRLIVPFAPGGGSDTLARLMGQWLSERLGQQLVIENRPGGGASIGTEAAVRASPDGYTLFLAGGLAFDAKRPA